jgi:hypothetical protein
VGVGHFGDTRMTDIDVKVGYDEVFLCDLSARLEDVTYRVKPCVFLTFRQAIG